MLFFTLSGFVLYLLLQRARLSMAGYVVKRVMRLYVPYAAAVMIGVVGAYGVDGDTLTGFNSWIWNETATQELQQPTQPGNASDRLPSDAVRVTVQSAENTVSIREVSPNPFTPNGDGVNDAAAWTFDVYLLTAATDISVTLFNLNGREIREIGMASTAGELVVTWDGTDESGDLVPPGIYLYRLFVDSDTDESKEQLGTIAVAY